MAFKDNKINACLGVGVGVGLAALLIYKGTRAATNCVCGLFSSLIILSIKCPEKVNTLLVCVTNGNIINI